MKVCVVSTWPPYWDGVALYSAKLHREVGKYLQVEIIANRIKSQSYRSTRLRETENIILHRSWKRGNPLCLLQMLYRMLESRANVFHLHHGWLMYGNHIIALLFPFIILFLHLIRKPVIVTMHTVIRRDANLYRNGFFNECANILVFVITTFLIKFSSKIIVHNRLMKQVLAESYGSTESTIKIIPHGVEKASQVNSETIETCEAQPRQYVLSIGFFRKDKGLEFLIEAFEKQQKTHPEIGLVLILSPHPHDDDRYAQKIKLSIPDLGRKSKIVLKRFVAEEELSKIIYKSDIIALLSQNNAFVESSGALARIADFQKPVICSRVPKFQSELTHNYDCIMVAPRNSAEIFNAIDLLLREKLFKNRIARNLKKKFSSRYWTDVAKQHVRLYESFGY